MGQVTWIIWIIWITVTWSMDQSNVTRFAKTRNNPANQTIQYEAL